MQNPSYFKQVGAQVTAIVIAASAAALFTFFQSVAVQSGACPTLAPDPATAGSLAALIKGVHSAFLIGTVRVS